MPLTRTYSKQKLGKQFKKKKASSISYIGPNTTMQVRILQEPDQWSQVYSHYIDKKFSWCTEDNGDCEGCERDEKKKELWIINVLDRKSGAVTLLQIPFSLAQQLFRRYERYDTLLDRDFELIRTGAGLDTEYSYDPMDKSRFNATRYTDSLLDAEAAVAAEVENSTDEPKSTKSSSKKKSREEDDDDDYEDEEGDEVSYEDLDRSELKALIRKSDPDFVVKKSHTDDKLREYLYELAEEDEDEEEDEEEEPPPPPKKKPRTSRHKDEDDEDYDGLDEFRPEKSSNPGPRKSPSSNKSRVVRRNR